MMLLGEHERPELDQRLEACADADRLSGRVDDAELARIARVVRRMRGRGGERASLDVLGTLTSDLAMDLEQPLGGEPGAFPWLRRALKRVVRGALRTRTASAFERQRSVNLAIHSIAEGMLADREEQPR